MSKGSAPRAPDPYVTAAAQAGANKESIQESAKVSAVDQQAPWGSTTYTRDANGVPIRQNITLGPNEQEFYERSGDIRNTLAGNAERMAGYLPQNRFELPDSAQADKVQQTLYHRRLNMVRPEMDRVQNDMNVQLMERGIPIGSEIYNKEQDRLARGRSDTLASLSQDAILAGGQEQDRLMAQALTLRNQPFNEVSAYLQGAPAMQTPQFQGSPAYQIAAPDLAGLITNDYNTRQQNYNSQNSSLMNGLFGLGSAGLSMLSDRRYKKSIRRVGETDGGVPIYVYEYKHGKGQKHMGVMADEVTHIPGAVSEIAGVKYVDYERIA